MLKPQQCALQLTPRCLFDVQRLQALFNYSPAAPHILAQSAVLKTTRSWTRSQSGQSPDSFISSASKRFAWSGKYDEAVVPVPRC